MTTTIDRPAATPAQIHPDLATLVAVHAVLARRGWTQWGVEHARYRDGSHTVTVRGYGPDLPSVERALELLAGIGAVRDDLETLSWTFQGVARTRLGGRMPNGDLVHVVAETDPALPSADFIPVTLPARDEAASAVTS